MSNFLEFGSEKDKKDFINGYKETIEENQQLKQQLAEARKQVCDEIRQKAIHTKTGYMGFTEKGYYTIHAGVLERIEKGE